MQDNRDMQLPDRSCQWFLPLVGPSQFSADIPTGAREEQAGRGGPEPSPFSNLANLSSTRLC